MVDTVNVEILVQYTFSRMALDAGKYYVSKKNKRNSTQRTNCYLRESLVARKCLPGLDAQKLSCAKISRFTVLPTYHNCKAV